MGFKNSNFYIPVLFYADDGLILSNSRKEMGQMISLVMEASAECGLNINVQKSQCMIINKKAPKPEKINDIEIVQEIKYLGIRITESRKYMKKYKETKLQLARKMSNVALSVVARSCNRILIGKTYWKSVVLPSILTGGAVVDWNKSELEQLQRIENIVWRHVLGAPSYVAVEALRGEVGSATMEERDMKIKLCYTKHVLKGNNELLKEILIEMKENSKGSQWFRTIRGYYLYGTS